MWSVELLSFSFFLSALLWFGGATVTAAAPAATVANSEATSDALLSCQFTREPPRFDDEDLGYSLQELM